MFAILYLTHRNQNVICTYIENPHHMKGKRNTFDTKYNHKTSTQPIKQ